MKEIKRVECPVCNATIEEYYEDQYLYGSPIVKCPKCGAAACDRRYHEITVDGIYVGDKLYVPVWKVLLTLAFLALLGFALSPTCGWYLGLNGMVVMTFVSIIGLVLLICMDISSIRDYFLRKKKLVDLKAESVERIQDPAYVEQLAAFGLHVQKEYLPAKADEPIEEVVFHDGNAE